MRVRGRERKAGGGGGGEDEREAGTESIRCDH